MNLARLVPIALLSALLASGPTQPVIIADAWDRAGDRISQDRLAGKPLLVLIVDPTLMYARESLVYVSALRREVGSDAEFVTLLFVASQDSKQAAVGLLDELNFASPVGWLENAETVQGVLRGWEIDSIPGGRFPAISAFFVVDRSGHVAAKVVGSRVSVLGKGVIDSKRTFGKIRDALYAALGKTPPPLVLDDGDFDGVPDSADACPDSVGSIVTRGCPAVAAPTTPVAAATPIPPPVNLDAAGEVEVRKLWERAGLAIDRGDFIAAVSLYEQVLGRLGGEPPVVLYDLARASYDAGDLEKAKRHIDRVLANRSPELAQSEIWPAAIALAARIEEEQLAKQRERRQRQEEEARRRAAEEARQKKLRRCEASCRPQHGGCYAAAERSENRCAEECRNALDTVGCEERCGYRLDAAYDRCDRQQSACVARCMER